MTTDKTIEQLKADLEKALETERMSVVNFFLGKPKYPLEMIITDQIREQAERNLAEAIEREGK